MLKKSMFRVRCAAVCLTYCLGAGPALAGPKDEVLNELMFCMNFYSGMSTQVSAASKGKMEAVRDAFMALAVDLAESDQKTLEAAVKTTADRAAGEIVGKSPEQRMATSQMCAPLLASDGVQKEITARSTKK